MVMQCSIMPFSCNLAMTHVVPFAVADDPPDLNPDLPAFRVKDEPHDILEPHGPLATCSTATGKGGVIMLRDVCVLSGA